MNSSNVSIFFKDFEQLLHVSEPECIACVEVEENATLTYRIKCYKCSVCQMYTGKPNKFLFRFKFLITCMLTGVMFQFNNCILFIDSTEVFALAYILQVIIFNSVHHVSQLFTSLTSDAKCMHQKTINFYLCFCSNKF